MLDAVFLCFSPNPCVTERRAPRGDEGLIFSAQIPSLFMHFQFLRNDNWLYIYSNLTLG